MTEPGPSFADIVAAEAQRRVGGDAVSRMREITRRFAGLGARDGESRIAMDMDEFARPMDGDGGEGGPHAMFAAQGGRCAACDAEPGAEGLTVDRDRAGRLRGLLCIDCIDVIRRHGDDPTWLGLIAAYLERKDD